MNIYDDEVSEIKELWGPEFYVLWNLGNKCTYKCSYCPEHFHSGSVPFHSTEVIQNFFKKLPKAHIVFTGGEATFHDDFEKIVLEKPDHLDISVISNASRPIGFWERIGAKLRLVVLTYHMEYAHYDRFLATADLIYNTYKRNGRINLTMIPEKWEQCVEVYEKLVEAKLRVIPKPLIENFGMNSSRVSTAYTPEQLEWISTKNRHEGHKNILVLDKDGKELYKTNPSELLSSNQANFKNWLCHANMQSMYILTNGDVYMSTCKQRVNIGSIHTDSPLAIPTEPFVCKQNFCWCHTDLTTKKVKL